MSKKGLDKNSIIGLMLIGAIMLIFSYITKPSKKELAAQKAKEKKEIVKNEPTQINHDTTISTANTVIDSTVIHSRDSLKQVEQAIDLGAFSGSAKGTNQHFVIENNKIKVTLSSKGGRVCSVQLKNFHTYDSLPLILFHEDSSTFNLNLIIPGITGGSSIRTINTENLYFETSSQSFSVTGDDSKTFSFKLYSKTKDKYIEYKYTLTGNSFLVNFDINFVGLNNFLSDPPLLTWSMFTPNQEKTIPNQTRRSTVYYKYSTGEVDYLSTRKYKEEKLETSVDWIMFKQQYFNSTLIAKNKPFEKADAIIKTIKIPEGKSKNYVKGMETKLTIPYHGLAKETFPMQYYFGPNQYQDLKDVNVGLEESKNYGWSIFGWVSKHFIRYVFEFFNGLGLPVGISILLLTLVIKSMLFPITWKTYISSAKMKVLKPEIAEITAKYKNDAMKKQQATMALYRQTGVNPLAGCIPMLIQMPILFALFRFFPATFALRQKSFLWAEDLSTYDSIYTFPHHFSIPMYGDHISLFTLLMAISMIFYTKVNSQMTAGMGGDAGGAMASQMKIMTYLMPVMMLFFFNNYSSGLSMYYLIANLITIAQQIIIRKWIVDEDKIHAKIQLNKTKIKKKSSFASKIEKRMKDAQTLQKQRKRK